MRMIVPLLMLNNFMALKMTALKLNNTSTYTKNHFNVQMFIDENVENHKKKPSIKQGIEIHLKLRGHQFIFFSLRWIIHSDESTSENSANTG